MQRNFTIKNLKALKIYFNTSILKTIKIRNNIGLQDRLDEQDKINCGLGSLALGTLELNDLLASENKYKLQKI